MDAVDFLLYFAAWVGHAAIWLVALNVLYSRPIHKEILRVLRLLIGVLVFSFPLVVAALIRTDVIGPGSGGDALMRYPVTLAIEIYLDLCLLFCVIVIPAVTLARLLRRRPPQLVARESTVIDYAREFGRKPVGDGEYWRLALLPGTQVFQVEFVEVTLRLPGLPAAWDGLTILQLSDLHLNGTPERRFFEAVLDRGLAGGVPDIVAITGDLIDTDVHHRWLLRLLGRLKWNEAALAILGNHDFWFRPERIRRRLARAGATVLGNGWRELRVRGEPLLAIGHEGPWFGPGPDLSRAPAAGFRLCLSHTPDNIRWARQNNIRLMLCGHNHGGQIRLPLFGSLFVPSRYSRKYDCGLFWEEPTLMYVARGLGGREPLRYNCRPEVTRFILRTG